MADTLASRDALASIKSLLQRFGLEGLSDWAWQQLLAGSSQAQVELDLYEQPAFKARFPAIAQRVAKGLPAITPNEYLAYENAARQVMRAAGFPPSFYDQPDDFTRYLVNDKSIAELSQDAALYQQAAYQAPQEVRDQLRNLYGIDEGGIAAYYADPDRALPILQQQFTASQIAGQAQRQQFGQLSQSEAERLAALGVTDQQAAQGFGLVQQAGELFQALPGEAEGAPGRDTALGLVAGDAAAQSAVDLQARRRKAGFQGGGSYAQTQRGTSGLASANT